MTKFKCVDGILVKNEGVKLLFAMNTYYLPKKRRTVCIVYIVEPADIYFSFLLSEPLSSKE